MLIFKFCLYIYIIFKWFLVKKHSFFKLCEYCGVPCLLGHTRVETEYTRFDHFWHPFANFALGIDTQIYVFLVFSVRSVQTALINGHHNMISKRFLIRNGKSAPLWGFIVDDFLIEVYSYGKPLNCAAELLLQQLW